MFLIEDFFTLQQRLWAELDWEGLGGAYCDQEAPDFFDAERRDLIRDVGLEVALDLTAHLPAGGRSLYVGAGVAELVPLCVEALLQDREVRALTLPGREADELERALSAAEEALRPQYGTDFTLPRVEGLRLEDATLDGPFDHVWCASVLNDPDAFPALHDHLYERFTEDAGATGRGSLEGDVMRARLWLETLEPTLAERAALSTSDEEWCVWGPYLEERGWTAAVHDEGRISALVGDRVRLFRLTQAGAGAEGDDAAATARPRDDAEESR